ncbi:MAG: hypothetical protein KDD44_03105 [Bdellovibrionales bacterium]|nr:hypothetical protein [Bdellovibrionales bacterium]
MSGVRPAADVLRQGDRALLILLLFGVICWGVVTACRGEFDSDSLKAALILGCGYLLFR